MLETIIKESESTVQFAKRAEAWASSEANPPTDEAMAEAWATAWCWRKGNYEKCKSACMRDIKIARRLRIAQRGQLFKQLEKGLR